MIFEIDEDSEGAYPVREFTVDEPDYDLYIRIAADSSRAKINFVNKLNGKKTCQPESGVVLKKTTEKL